MVTATNSRMNGGSIGSSRANFSLNFLLVSNITWKRKNTPTITTGLSMVAVVLGQPVTLVCVNVYMYMARRHLVGHTMCFKLI